jgi:hypothetical protein
MDMGEYQKASRIMLNYTDATRFSIKVIKKFGGPVYVVISQYK